MTLNALVAICDGSAADARALAAAALLARETGAGVQVAPAFADAAANLIYFGASLGQGQSSEIAERLAAAEQSAHEKIIASARAAAAGAGLENSALVVQRRELSPAAALARAAALTDLLIISSELVAGELRPLFVEALISMRAPVLMLKAEFNFHGAAAIAWDGSLQAGRAVRAAMPLLRAASRVVLLTNEEDHSADHLAVTTDRARAYLARAGVASVDARGIKGADVAHSLLAAARSDECGLLVAGAYGRPRFQELVLGGTTRALVNAGGSPNLLLAH